MNTLPTKFGFYRCTDSANILNSSILIMFLGTVVAHVFMAIFGDFFGRKRFILVGAFVSIIGIIGSLVFKNIFLVSFFLAVGSFGLQIVFTIGFNIIS
jgi:MFS family permease